MKPKSLLLLATITLGLLPQANAADGTWLNGGEGNWDTSANWAGGVIASGSNFTADFSAIDPTGYPSVELLAPRTIGNLIFGSTSSYFGYWTLGNNGNASNVLTLAATSGSPIIAVDNNVYATIDAVIAGTSGFTKTGASSLLTLTAANTYTGTTRIKEGRLEISGAGTLGNHAALIIDDDTETAVNMQLLLGGTTQTVGTASISGSGDKVTNGNLIATSYTLSNSQSSSAGVISAGLQGSGATLTKNGTATSLLSGTNTYTGKTTVNSGTLQFATTASLYNGNTASWTKENLTINSTGILAVNVGGTGEFTLAQAKSLLTNLTTSISNNGLRSGSSFGIDTTNANSTVTFNQVIANSTGTGSGALGFTKLGEGTLTLNQANTYTGTTNVNGGTLAITGSGTLGTSSPLVINGGELDLGGTSQTTGPVTFKNGAVSNGNLTATSYTAAFSDYNQTVVSASLRGTGSTLNVSGSLALSGANTYTGATTISDNGSISVSGAGTLGVNAALTIYEGSLSLGGTTQTVGAVTLNNTYTPNAISGGNLVATSYSLGSSNPDASYTFNTISASLGGTANLTSTGVGRINLSGANTYTGTTNITSGVLNFNRPSALYNANEASWTKEKIMVSAGGTLSVALGGATGFTVGQAKTLLTGLTSNLANNGLKAGSSFGISIGIISPEATFDQVIADSTGIGGGAIGLTKFGFGTLILDHANTYTGATNIVAGTLKISGSGTLGIGSALILEPTAQLDLGGTTQTVGSLTLNGGSISNGNLVASTYSLTSGTSSISLAGSGSTLVKSGTDTAYLDATNSYTGATNVTAGKLVVNGNISTSILTTVQPGASLGGAGTVGALTIASGGTLSPGNSPGILNTGNYNQAGTLEIELTGTAAGTQYDQVNVTGTVTLSGILLFTTNGFTATNGNLFFLVNNDGSDAITGTFTGLAQSAQFTVDGQSWIISYNANSGTSSFSGGNDVALRSLAAIPEPSAIALLITALFTSCLGRRRR